MIELPNDLYKVVFRNVDGLESAIRSCSFPRKFLVRYIPGEIVYPIWEKSRLFVFKEKFHAEFFFERMNEDESRYGSFPLGFELWLARGYGSIRETHPVSLWGYTIKNDNDWEAFMEIGTPMPSVPGSYSVEGLKLIEKIK